MEASSFACAELTERILGAAYEVHRLLGPGLLESTYRACLVEQLARNGLGVQQQVWLPIAYKNVRIDLAYRADVIVERSVLLELKAVERLLPIHEAQTLTYMRHSRLKVGLLLNFNVTRLKFGVRRFVL